MRLNTDETTTLTREAQTANTGFASGGVIPHFMNTMWDKQCKLGALCLNSSAVLLLVFSGSLTVKCSEIPHERQAANRCVYADTPNNSGRQEDLIINSN
jgi:hypothetical protein